jgi:DNA-binding NarL/FixJ family response regulator
MLCPVFVVDPDATRGRRIADALLEMRLASIVTACGDAASAAICEHPGGLAIVSFEGEGFGLPLAVRLIAAGGPLANCVLATDHLHPALDRAARDLGILAVLSRPVRASHLAQAVEAHLLGLMSSRDTLAQTKRIA